MKAGVNVMASCTVQIVACDCVVCVQYTLGCVDAGDGTLFYNQISFSVNRHLTILDCEASCPGKAWV